MSNLALLDLLAPYVVRGENLGANHAALSLLRVVSYEVATDDFAITIRGRCEFNGRGTINPIAGGFTITSVVSEADPAFDPNRRSPVFDLRETSLDFELFVPRAASAIISAGEATITATGFAPARNVLTSWPATATPSDYPSSGFTLDLLLNAPDVRPPFLHPARMTDEGLLLPDTSVTEVAIHLPKLRFRLAHGNPAGSQLQFQLVSAGTSGLDDPGDIGVAELISMTPPYAFVGGRTDRTFGFGFRSAILDLSSDSTPPAIIEKFGFGDDWGGLYLPEVRVFFAPSGARDLAFEAGVRDLLIGLGDSDGVSGDFEVAVINQGGGDLVVSARFVDDQQRAYGIERVTARSARARIPAHTRMIVDVQGGRAPYTRTVSVNGGSSQTGAVFNIDLSTSSPQTISIAVHDAAAGTAHTATLDIVAERRVEQATLPTPGTPAPVPLTATFTPGDATPLIEIATQDDREVVLRTNPLDATIRWSTDGGTTWTPPRSTLSMQVTPGETRQVMARRPGSTVPSTVDFFFYFDQPAPEHSQANEEAEMTAFGQGVDNVSTVRARSVLRSAGRDGNGQDPVEANAAYLDAAPVGTAMTVRGEASYENDPGKRDYNYLLARRRALVVKGLLRNRWPAKNFVISIDPEPRNPASYGGLAAWTANWQSHGAPADRDWWKASLLLPSSLGRPDDDGNGVVQRPSAPPVPTTPPPPQDPPPPAAPRPPDWFRSAKLKARIVRNALVAGEIEGEFDFQTAAEQRLSSSGQLGGATPPRGHSLQNGAPIGVDNPADGITKFHVLCQADSATGRVTTLLQVGADPADKDGLGYFGWMPGQTRPPSKDVPLTLLGSYLSFWPLLVTASDGNHGEIADAALTTAAIAIPGVIAALPWFRVERVVLYGAEYLQRDRGAEFEGFLLFDVGIDWSADIAIGGNTHLIQIDPQHPLSVRYKAIGVRLGNSVDSTAQFSLRPVFDASRGYSIDVARNGSLRVAAPFDQILRVLAARISRTNPLTLEVDIGMGVDLGVVAIDRARVRVYLNEARAPELTALAARVDIPGALAGSGYLQIGSKPDGTSTIGGQIDLTLRPLNLRVSAALEVAQIPPEQGGPATGVYVGLNVVLPVGIPLGGSGLGIFGFRGIFGMHYERNQSIGAGTGVPALAWLEAAGGKPERLTNGGVDLWLPKLDSWAFGLGMLIGTMEGGVIINLDGTLLLELPGPRVLIVMNARILTPPPSVDALGSSGGILAVIEISPEHFLIGLLIQWEIEKLITIRIPVEAVFPFGSHSNEWHIYLGQRADYGPPVEVNVLGLVKGTGYLMFKGDGIKAYNGLPEVKGFGIALGAGASFTWGSTDIGLYLRIGGGMDAVIGFDPFVLGGKFNVSGELRLFIISIGAHAELTVVVSEQPDPGNPGHTYLSTYIHGEACGHVDFFFFSIEGCVDITIASEPPAPPVPDLVQKVSIKSRSPALLVGTGVDRPVDASLGDALDSDAQPAATAVLEVPIDSIPVIAMAVPPVAKPGLRFNGSTDITTAPGVPAGGFAERGAEKYRYQVDAVGLERVGGGPALLGSGAPVVWWTQRGATDPNQVAQLALLTWEPTPAAKAIEKTEQLKETIRERWGTICHPAAPAAPVLWTFRFEPLGASPTGWELEGIAWPDPDHTRRSTAADTTLHVSERWRSGDARIDAMRGLMPALVLGSVVPCPRRDRRLTAARPSLVVGGRGPIVGPQVATAGRAVAAADPLHDLLGRGDEQTPVRISEALYEKARATAPLSATPLDVAGVQRRLSLGQAVSRAELSQAVGPAAALPAATATQPGTQCEVRLLEAPIFDDGRTLVFGDPGKEDEIKRALERARVSHGPLDNVVVLETGAFQMVELLLFVRGDVLEPGHLAARVMRGDDQVHAVVAQWSDIVGSRPLPARWTDPSGPWMSSIAELLAWSHDERWYPIVLEVPKGEDADRIELGVIRTDPSKRIEPAYYVGAVEATRMSEAYRQDWDDTLITKDHDVITHMLGAASTDSALLYPSSLYKLTVGWTAERQGDHATGGRTQTFWFRTDGEAPKRLDPWMLCTLPGDGETGYFGGEPVRLVFNTSDLDRLYGAYGKELRVRFQAASAHHPAPRPGVPHPFPINATTLHPIKAAILSPWEEAAVEVLTEARDGEPAPCVPVDVDRVRHSELTIPIPLDPFTDYILDVVMVAAGAPDTATGDSVYRRHFSTGGFATRDDFAASLKAVKPSARSVEPGRMATIRGYFAGLGRPPIGAELDEQLRTAGIELSGAPDQPRVTVLWEQVGAALPQPVALLVDASEPLWRSRPYPTKVLDSSGPVDAERWVLEAQPWLQLDGGATAAGVIAPGGIIPAPGLQRALVILAPNARDKTVKLDLVAVAVPAPVNVPELRSTIVDLKLTRAPWEE